MNVPYLDVNIALRCVIWFNTSIRRMSSRILLNKIFHEQILLCLIYYACLISDFNKLESWKVSSDTLIVDIDTFDGKFSSIQTLSIAETNQTAGHLIFIYVYVIGKVARHFSLLFVRLRFMEINKIFPQL